MPTIVNAVLVLGGLGLFFACLLTLASRKFNVEKDERLDVIEKILPSANCGACGYAGCSAYAAAILDGEDPSHCSVGGELVYEKICGVMNIKIEANTKLVAMVRCSGGSRAVDRFVYEGIADCTAAMQIGGGPKACRFGCLGLGTCVASCPFGAISVIDGVAVVDNEICTGCMTCARFCPKKIIVPVPYYGDVNLACSSQEKGGILRHICDIGCLGCHKCEKICQQKAIVVVDNLATIDYDKCSGCGDCAEVCPRNLILDCKLDRQKVGE